MIPGSWCTLPSEKHSFLMCWFLSAVYLSIMKQWFLLGSTSFHANEDSFFLMVEQVLQENEILVIQILFFFRN